jgi:hypothetical protein
MKSPIGSSFNFFYSIDILGVHCVIKMKKKKLFLADQLGDSSTWSLVYSRFAFNLHKKLTRSNLGNLVGQLTA